MRVKKLALSIETKRGTYEAIFRWDVKDKAYIVNVPSLSGVVTFGKNLKDAKRMAKDAIELYCEYLIEDGNIIIDDQEKAVGNIPHSRIIAVR